MGHADQQEAIPRFRPEERCRCRIAASLIEETEIAVIAGNSFFTPKAFVDGQGVPQQPLGLAHLIKEFQRPIQFALASEYLRKVGVVDGGSLHVSQFGI